METMSSTKKGPTSTRYEYTARVCERRRSLFPPEVIDSDEDSDLGHISPLNYDSDQEVLKFLVLKQTQPSDNGSVPNADSIGDYDIIGVVENIQGSISTPLSKNYACSETMSPLYLSPHTNKFKCVPEPTIINETPSKISPTYSLKTPHDATNTNSKLPKLVRKSLLDALESTSNKRKLSPFNSPQQTNKCLKLDPKNSKVRTTLFPEVEFALSTKSFYPKTETKMDRLNSIRRENFTKPVLSKSRKTVSRKKVGQINAGVGHKIRKPKQKKINKNTLVKAAVNTLMTNSAINEYINDLKDLKAAQNDPTKLIENKENSDPKLAEQKFVDDLHTPKTADVVVPSPTLEPNPNKKFFKFSRTKAVVTVNKNMKVQVDNGKMTLLENVNKKKTVQKFDFDSSDLTVEEPLLPQANIDNILTSLDDKDDAIEVDNSTKIVLHAHSSVSASENSILLHTQPMNCAANLILSPISQMCDVTSGLALNSPKKAKNLTTILNGMTNAASSSANIFNKEESIEKQKFFPIFCNRNVSHPMKREGKVLTRTAKRFKIMEESQMLLDAGQKRFGVTQCPECNIVYHIGDPSDENMHLNYHNAGHILRFAGWKNERVIADFHANGRIIQICPEDSKMWWKKAKDLMDLINRELGCYNLEFNLDHCQIFLYIKSRTITGCVVAVPHSKGHKMLTTSDLQADMCSEETYPIKCGIPRIWVSHNHRKQGIATALMNAVKKNFMFGYILNNCDIALSPPTDMGKSFAERYFKSRNYLIYYV